MKLFSKNRKRITAAVLSALLLCAAPLSYADDTVADMEAKQTELANKKADLENKISSLESQEADKTEYLTLLSEKIDTIKEQIDTANSDITVLNTSIKKLEKELSDSADQISDTMELLKKRLAVLYSAGCTVGTLEILFNSESLHDFSMRAEAVSTITRHDKQLIDTVAAYMNETKAQREELEKEKTALADAKKLYESSEEELKQLESDNTALLEQIRSDKSSAETELSRTEEEEYVLANMMAAKIAEMQQQMAQAKAPPTPPPVPTVRLVLDVGHVPCMRQIDRFPAGDIVPGLLGSGTFAFEEFPVFVDRVAEPGTGKRSAGRKEQAGEHQHLFHRISD